MNEIHGPALEADDPGITRFTPEQVCKAFGVPLSLVQPILDSGTHPMGGYIDPAFTKRPPDTPSGDIGAPLGPYVEPQGQSVVELDLGPDDVLVLCYDQTMTADQRARLGMDTDAVLSSSGRRSLVLDAGVVPMVLHRTIPAEDKPRKPVQYLEDAGPCPSKHAERTSEQIAEGTQAQAEREAARGRIDTAIQGIAAGCLEVHDQASRGTSEDSEA